MRARCRACPKVTLGGKDEKGVRKGGYEMKIEVWYKGEWVELRELKEGEKREWVRSVKGRVTSGLEESIRGLKL